MEYVFEEYIRKSDYQEILLSYFSKVGCKQVFEKKELLECTHRPLNEVYLITSGKVKQYYIKYDGTERTILLLSEGDMFGEITLYQEDFDKVITEALEKTEVRRINKNLLFDILNNNPQLYDAILEMVTTKFRILMAQNYDSTFFPINNRLISLLIRL